MATSDEPQDARFEDAAERPLRLRALDPEDLRVVSALVQDAVVAASDMRWDRRRRRFALLVNRFRWEAGARTPERVRSVLVIEEALAVRAQGLSRDRDLVLSILQLTWEPGEDGTGRLVLTLAGDGAIAVECEALGVVLHDATRPYRAVAGRAPTHPDD